MVSNKDIRESLLFISGLLYQLSAEVSNMSDMFIEPELEIDEIDEKEGK